MDKITLANKLIELFESFGKPLRLNDIGKELKVRSDSPEHQKIKLALDELINDGTLVKSKNRKYSLVEQKDYSVKGVLVMKDDSGYIETNLPDLQKVSIKRRSLFTAFEGDTVQVKLLAKKFGRKPIGEVVQVLKRKERFIAGTIEYDGSFYFLIPDDDVYYLDFLIHSDNLHGAGEGDKVTTKFLTWKDPQKSPEVEVVEILGKSGEPKVEYQSILFEYNLPFDFPKEVIEEAHRVSLKIDDKLIKNRLDLRKEDIITIDPDDAKDFDDALSMKLLENGNYEVGVHIADVSHYVTSDGKLDDEAIERGNSTYLVDRVVPMLPEELSNELCSLQPNRVRLAFSVIMEMTKQAVVKNYIIKESVIRSKKRFTYEEVQGIIEGKEHKYKEMILNLNDFAKKLREKRFKTGGIDFQSIEIKFILDETGHPIKAIPKKSSDATQLVEEFMLLANKTVAEHIRELSKQHNQKKLLPFLYRTHDDPLPEKVKSVLDYIKIHIPEKKIKLTSSKAINHILEQFENSPEKPIIHQLLIRSMAKAEYSSVNIGHYGLGFKEYTHFTSPIRRYPDLLVHRLLKEYSQEKLETSRIKKITNQLEQIGKHCTEREKVSMDAERQSIKLAQTVYALDYIGKEFYGTISGLTNFGIFVLLDDLLAEGMIPLRDLYDDYYIFDETAYKLIGRRTKRTFYFGKPVRVQIMSADIKKRKIELRFVGDR